MKNKLNSSRHRIFVSSYNTNWKKHNYFYKRIRSNSFFSVDKQIILRGRTLKNNRRTIKENETLFFPHVMGICMHTTWDRRKTTFSRFIKLNNGVCMYLKCPRYSRAGDYFCTLRYHRIYRTIEIDQMFDYLKIYICNGFFTCVKFVEQCSICYNFFFTYAKSAGTFCKIFFLFFWWLHAYIKLPSTRRMVIPSRHFVFLGRCSNFPYTKVVIGNAGTNRYRGRRPKVRGVAMNPVDHPNGGRTKTCRPLKNLWGKIAKKNK